MFDAHRLRALADELSSIGGVRAVTLGGSRARGTHRPDSDVDLGIYCGRDLDLVALARLAACSSETSTRIAAPGEWGPWVNGGAWLRIDGVAVDWILRDLRRVREQCDRAIAGEFAFHVQAGHPLGFLDVSYAAEVATAIPLRDDDGVLGELSAQLTPYPEALRAAMLDELWQVDFLLDAAEKGAKSSDAAHVALCLSIAAMRIAHGWHALAGKWVTNEKGLVPAVAHLPLDSEDFSDRVDGILGDLGSTSDGLLAAVSQMRAVPRPTMPTAP